MKFDKKIFAGFSCAVGIHAAIFTADLPKPKNYNASSDLVFEKSYSSVEISFASAPVPKPKEVKKKIFKKKEIKQEITDPFLKELKTVKTDKPDITIPKEVKKEVKKVEPKKHEKSVVKENIGVAKKIVKPVRIYNQAPVYPLFAVRMGFEGTVMLNLTINEKGVVKDVIIKKSSGHRLLDNSAKDAAYKWKFSPAKKAGVSIIYKKDVPVVFRLKEE